MVVNELRKSIGKKIILDNFSTYMLRKIKLIHQKNDYDMDL
jgi:hypothetical protein